MDKMGGSILSRELMRKLTEVCAKKAKKGQLKTDVDDKECNEEDQEEEECLEMVHFKRVQQERLPGVPRLQEGAGRGEEGCEECQEEFLEETC